MVYGLSSTPHNKFRREPTQRAGRLWLPEEEPLKKQEEPEPPKSEPPKRLACPYLIYDPTTYESHQGCRGAAFPDTSRLKEHLYRSHRQQPHCAKCGEPFADESSQEKHGVCSSSLTHSVTGNHLQELKGFDKEQEARLRDRKRKRGESNEEKWKDIFNILFPDTTEIPSPYYKSPARKEFQDGAAESRNVINYSLINNLFNNHVADSMARSQVEKTQGPMPEEGWRKMKEIFRGFVLSGLKKPRESQTSVCGSSTSSASHQAPGAKGNARSSQKENFDHGDISSTILNIDRQTEAPANSREPDLAHVLPSIDIDDWLAGGSNRSRPPHRPKQASTNSKPQTARQPSQPISPNLPSTPSLSNTSADEATSGPKSSLSTKQAPEDGLDPYQEATAEICEERVFNNLNLTPEECLAAALQQNTLIWQQPEDKDLGNGQQLDWVLR
ncbi:hypothetical protein CGCVW01_v002137 [Colletotrichum viniferum]|nr:hypothetical protein CGCVW01_v002137 [Colletotrichum viniferum]